MQAGKTPRASSAAHLFQIHQGVIDRLKFAIPERGSIARPNQNPVRVNAKTAKFSALVVGVNAAFIEAIQQRLSICGTAGRSVPRAWLKLAFPSGDDTNQASDATGDAINGLVVVLSVAQPQYPNTPNTCLLYTSDAADE